MACNESESTCSGQETGPSEFHENLSIEHINMRIIYSYQTGCIGSEHWLIDLFDKVNLGINNGN
jgi:hypothetical protein